MLPGPAIISQINKNIAKANKKNVNNSKKQADNIIKNIQRQGTSNSPILNAINKARKDKQKNAINKARKDKQKSNSNRSRSKKPKQTKKTTSQSTKNAQRIFKAMEKQENKVKELMKKAQREQTKQKTKTINYQGFQPGVPGIKAVSEKKQKPKNVNVADVFKPGNIVKGITDTVGGAAGILGNVLNQPPEPPIHLQILYGQKTPSQFIALMQPNSKGPSKKLIQQERRQYKARVKAIDESWATMGEEIQKDPISYAIAGGSVGLAPVTGGLSLLGLGIVAPSIAKDVSISQTAISDPKLNKHLRSKTYTQAKNYVRNQIQKDIEKSASVTDDIGAFIPGVDQYQQHGKVKKYFKEFYKNRGYSNKFANKIANFAQDQNAIEGVFDVAGTAAGVEAGAEIIGKKAGAKISAKIFGKTAFKTLTKKQVASGVTKSALPALYGAGMYEGGAEYLKEQLKEEQPIKLYETHKIGPVPVPGGLAGSAFLGGAFASLLGGSIARTSVTRPKTSKGLLTMARIIDPYETPGDIIGGAAYKGGIFAPTWSSSKSSSKGSASKSKGDTFNFFNIFNFTPEASTMFSPTPTPSDTTTPTPTPTDTPNNTKDGGGVYVPSPGEVPDITTVPVEKKTFDPVIPTPDPDPGVPDPGAPTPSNTTTPTPTPSTSAVNVPTATPLMRVTPPLFPFGAPGGGPGSGGKRGSKGKKVFYDERKAAIKVLKRVL